MNRLDPKQAAILAIDIQEKLAAAMPEDGLREVERATRIMRGVSEALSVPWIVTEQYPQGLGPSLGWVVGKGAPIVKTTFSAWDCAAFVEHWKALGRTQVVILGMEAHICVFQTARDFAKNGVETFVLGDGALSRAPSHRATGLQLCQSAGAFVSVAEAVAFDLLRQAGSEAFKVISKLVR